MTESAVCAVHPGQPAYTTCARCGNFACSYCLGDRDVCGACVARDEGEVIPWERKDLSLLARFWRTTRDVIAAPVRALCEQRSTSNGAAMSYALVAPAIPTFATLLCCAPLTVVGLMLQPRPLGGMEAESFVVGVVAIVVGFAFIPLGVLGATLIRSVIFHATARAVGGIGGFDVSLRACAYMTAFIYVDLCGALLAWIPIVGAVIALFVLVVELVWSGRTLTATARAHHGLVDRRAAIAGWTVPLLYFLFGLAALLLLFFAQFSGGPAPDSYD